MDFFGRGSEIQESWKNPQIQNPRLNFGGLKTPSAVDVSTDLCAFGGLRGFGYSVTNGSNRF